MKLKIRFHLFHFKNTLTFPNGKTKVYECKSHGGIAFLLWMIGSFVSSRYHYSDFSLWNNVVSGLVFALIWDLFTAISYRLRIRRIIEKNS